MDKTIIWDLDGTLLDSFGVFEGVLVEILPQHGKAVPSHERMLANFHGTLEESINSALGGIPPEELQAILADFLVAQNVHYEVIEHHIFPDALRLVKRAHAAGYRQILVTNREHEGRLRGSPRHIVQHSSLSKYIDMVVCGDDSEHRKPKPEVLGSLQIDPATTLVIGDQHVDAMFAHNLGAKPLIVTHGNATPDYTEHLGEGWQGRVDIVGSLDDYDLG